MADSEEFRGTSRPDMFSNCDVLECGFCFSRYETTAALTEHQQSRGHWLTVFDRRRRQIRRPARFRERVEDAEESVVRIEQLDEFEPTLEEVLVQAEEAEEEEEETEAEEEEEPERQQGPGEAGEAEEPVGQAEEEREGDGDGAEQSDVVEHRGEGVSVETTFVIELDPEEQADSAVTSDAAGESQFLAGLQQRSPSNMVSMTVKSLHELLSIQELREAQLPLTLSANIWKEVIVRRNQSMDPTSALSILTKGSEIECLRCPAKRKIFTAKASIFELGSNVLKHMRRHGEHPNKRSRQSNTLTKPANAAKSLHLGTAECRMFWQSLALAFLDGEIADVFVENSFLRETFRRFLNAPLPNRRQLAAIYSGIDAQMTSEIACQLAGAPTCHLSIDGWSSIHMQAYTGVMVHFLDQNFHLKVYSLGVCRFSKADGNRATAVNLANQVRRIIEDFPRAPGSRSILETTRCITTDATAVMPAMTRELAKESQLCFSHQLQLLMKAFVLSQDHLCVLVGIASKITSYVRRSTKASDSIGRRLVSFVPTRFDSYLKMLDSVITNFPAIQTFDSNNDTPEQFHIAVTEFSSLWTLANCLTKLLTPIASLTAQLGAERGITAHLVLKSIVFLQHSYRNLSISNDSELAAQASILLQHVNTRLTPFFQKRELLIAAVLCPVIGRELSVAISRQMDDAKRHLRFEMNLLSSVNVASSATSSLSGSSTGSVIAEKLDFDTFLSPPPQRTSSPVDDEIDLFFRVPKPQCRNVAAFWRAHQSTFPIMSQVARSFLSIPPSSLACERLFSTAGRVVTPLRNRISPKRINIMTRAKQNLLIFRQNGLPSSFGFDLPSISQTS
jgi:hypothetical protein